MILSPDETERFYRTWFALLHFVNQQRRLVPSFPATWQQVPLSTVKTLRDALWADDALREAFLATNPAGLSPADCAVVASWQYRIVGTFFLFRYLKKHTIFLTSSEPAHAYGALGLVSPIEEIAGPSLPMAVAAVLLPFEERIIYDSLLEPYAVSFGPGIRRSLQQSYRDAQEHEGIITSLLPAEHSLATLRADLEKRNARLLAAFRKELARSSMSVRTMEQHVETIAAVARWLLEEEPPHGLLALTRSDLERYLAMPPGRASPVSFRRFVRFLRATGRLEYTAADELADVLQE
jgi:hypothetical protein